MPDVSRSDSQRSDTSLRPRVSFNRDVHVKRIVPREGTRTVGALSRDGHGHFVTAPIRKERPNKSRKQLAAEATQVLNQADKLNCITQPKGVSPEKFYTLPVRRRDKQNYASLSLDRRTKRNNSESTGVVPSKKPPRTTIFDLFKKKTDTKKSNLKRSNSDASNLKSYRTPNDQPLTSSDCEITNLRINKKLSPIIEITPREDYFTPNLSDNNKENNGNSENIDEKTKSITETLKEFIDEIDGELLRDKTTTEKKNVVEVIIIDVDKAEKISPKKSKLQNIGAKLKSITNKTESNEDESINRKSIRRNQTKSPEMIHSSQRPADKLPLTKGRTVDSIARRLDNDKRLPPPPTKPTVMVIPNLNVQHNNNQPFSYTHGLSPDKYVSDENLSKPVIYAQVICNNDGRTGHKQTVHTTYKKQPNSDSDEGLGNEETSNLTRKYRIEKTLTHFGDDIVERNNNGESPILPKYRTGYDYNEKNYSEMFIDTTVRGRADGMDATKRRESLTEHLENEFETKLNGGGRSDLSARRDLLELRINQRIHDKNKFTKSGSSSPPPLLISRTYFGDNPTNKYNKSNYLNENEPKSFDSQISDYQSSPENRFESNHRRYEERTLKTTNLYKSTPDIYHQRYEERTNQQNSYHDSLKRDRNRTYSTKNKTDKDRFGDSGIENDIIRRDSNRKKYYYGNESEDEGFASSLLITNERQHTDENNQKRLTKKEYDSDRAYSGEDDNYRQEIRNNYVARERSIDDGSHFDPRIDKENGTLKRTENKPPKPEKKSGLEKVMQLFSRGDSKKKKKTSAAVTVAPKNGMVREESLRARYTEYKGSREHLVSKKNNIDESTTTLDHDYNNRRRLSTPSPSPTRETRDKPDTTTHTNWFKSLDRLSRKKTKKDDKVDEPLPPPKRPNSKSLRFFGDTDLEESSDGTTRSTTKHRNLAVNYKERTRSQSTRDLHNICENPELSKYNNNHKSMTNITQNRDNRESKTNLKPPASPHHHHHRSNRDISRMKDDRNRRRKYEISSVESSTEGDSSQQSQRSIVYLHAATIGDIPGPAYLRNTKRTASREELASNSSGRIQPQIKTLSRSFSVLAPWRPRHSSEANNIDYSEQQQQQQQQQQQPKPMMKYEQKSTRNSSSRKENSSTLKKKAQDTKKSMSTLNRRHNRNSSENLTKSRDELKGSSSTLYKKKERLPRENSRYTKERDDRKISNNKSMSVESLNHQNNRGELRRNRDISRSISMPKDTEKSAGWFKKKTTTNRY